MMKQFMMTVLAVVVVPMLLHAAGQTKVEICHIDDTGAYHLITIADPAYDAHIAHGDMNVPTFYIDVDGDGFGSSSMPAQACTAPSGYADNGADCDDTVATVNPFASEVLDNIDNNCDDQVDDCVHIRLHCDANSTVLETVCGADVHVLAANTAANISYVTFLGDTSSVVLNHCVDDSELSGQSLEILGDTDLCGLQGGAIGDPRWNDEVCSVEIH